MWHEDRKPRSAQTKEHYGSIPAYSTQQRKFAIVKVFCGILIIVDNSKRFAYIGVNLLAPCLLKSSTPERDIIGKINKRKSADDEAKDWMRKDAILRRQAINR